jgi:regulator of protease activity HflC (stomatin/prohibitin superfamily)
VNLTLTVITALAGAALILGLSGVRRINEHERGVVFRLGRFERMLQPGLHYVLPLGVDHVTHVDVRTIAIEVPFQEVITNDNVLVRVLAAVYLQVINPQLAVTKVDDYKRATAYLVQSTLRSFIGKVSLHQLLSGRDLVNEMLRRIIDEETEPWGIQVSLVEFKDVQLPETMQRAMGLEAEAEREKNAKIITAEAELATARTLNDAAEVISQRPSALQLRYLQALTEIGGDGSTVVVFPIPIDLLQPLFSMQTKTATTPSGGSASAASESPTPAVPPQ